VAERDLFEILERLDGRVDAPTPACPNTQKRGKPGDARMQIDHIRSLWIAGVGY
jgi:hypothetical protein